MADEQPIVLPSLAAQRQQPCAAVCGNGHVYSWFLDPLDETGYCPKCGNPILVACPACNAPLPPDGEMLKWVPYHTNCIRCGKPYPWIAADIARAKRTLAERSEVESWNEAATARASELVDDIVADRATPSEMLAALKWLAMHDCESAEPTILEAIERLGSAGLKQALRSSFPGQF